MDSVFIFGAKYAYFIAALLFVGFFFTLSRAGKKDFFILSVIYLPLTLLLARLSSRFYFDPRPFVSDHIHPLISHAADNGFPSDHALLTSALAAALTAYNKKVGIVAWAIALFVSVSRVMVGVHHATDIIGSFLISLLTLAIVYWGIMPRIRQSRWYQRGQ